jgi:hypothetical protein
VTASINPARSRLMTSYRHLICYIYITITRWSREGDGRIAINRRAKGPLVSPAKQRCAAGVGNGFLQKPSCRVRPSVGSFRRTCLCRGKIQDLKSDVETLLVSRPRPCLGERVPISAGAQNRGQRRLFFWGIPVPASQYRTPVSVHLRRALFEWFPARRELA